MHPEHQKVEYRKFCKNIDMNLQCENTKKLFLISKFKLYRNRYTIQF